MFWEIESANWYGSEWRLQINVENFFPCSQAKMLKLFKMVDSCDYDNVELNHKLTELLHQIDLIDTEDFSETLLARLDKNIQLLKQKLYQGWW